MLTLAEQLKHYRNEEAQKAYETHDFGKLAITDHEGWDNTEDGNRCRTLYAEGEGGDSFRLSYHVCFHEGSAVIHEAYALDVCSGSQVA